jgi:hypothetical protein
VLQEPETVVRLLETLAADQFYKDGHRKIYAAMRRLHERGDAADVLTVTEELKRAGELAEVGGQSALSTIQEEATVATQFATYARIVRDYAAKRAAIRLGRDLIDGGYNGDHAETLVALLDRRRAELDGHAAGATAARTPWALAVSAPVFLASTETERDFLEERLLAPGSVTEIFSPRGLGKTHVAHAVAVKLARAGLRVLFLDRDNSRREVRRRFRAWGAAEASTLKLLGRDQVPPLTNRAEWQRFPFADYDVVMIDSLDATTEGVGEQDSAKPSQAFAPLLDIAHREAGPAILVLGNTTRSAEHSRGSGIVEDRADIVYEVRDATDLKPTGTKPWWLELPAAGAGAWAERAARRKRRGTYRLAFVPSKFRIGEEPDPFVLEVDLSQEPWRLRDVTAEIVAAGEASRQAAEQERDQKRETASEALRLAVDRQARAGTPLLARTDAEPFLVERGLSRKAAREVIAAGEGRLWRSVTREAERGQPRVLMPVSSQGDGGPDDSGREESGVSLNRAGQNPGVSGNPHGEPLSEAGILAARSQGARPKSTLSAAAPSAGIVDPSDFGRPFRDTLGTGPGQNGQERLALAPGAGDAPDVEAL